MKPPSQDARYEPGQIPDVFIRKAMPAAAETVFDALTTADGLALWLCDRAVSDAREGGAVTATWDNPDHPGDPGKSVSRRASWVEFERPTLAYLRWDDPSPDWRHDRPEMLKFAVACVDGQPHNCSVTVVSPCPQGFEHTTPATVQDATRQAWEQLLDELAAALAAWPPRVVPRNRAT